VPQQGRLAAPSCFVQAWDWHCQSEDSGGVGVWGRNQFLSCLFTCGVALNLLRLLRHLSNGFDYTYDRCVCVATCGIVPQKFDIITVVAYKCIKTPGKLGQPDFSSAYLGFI